MEESLNADTTYSLSLLMVDYEWSEYILTLGNLGEKIENKHLTLQIFILLQ